MEEKHIKPFGRKRSVRSECQICGSSAIYSYFGVISCEACKIFFKRHALSRQVSLVRLTIISIDILFSRIIPNVVSKINALLIHLLVIYVRHVDCRNVFEKE